MGEIEFIPVDDGCDPLECYRFVEVFFDVGFGALTSGGAAEAEWTDNAGRLPHRKSVFFVVLPGSCAGVRGSFPGGRRVGRSGRGRRFLLRGSETVGYRFPTQYSAFSFPVRSARCGGLWD